MAFKDHFKQFQSISVSEDIFLRQVNPDQDVQAFYDIYCDEEAFCYFGGYKKPGNNDDTFRKVLVSRIRNFVNGNDYSWTVVYKGKVAGQIQLFHFQNSNTCAEVGFFIKREYWNKGINTAVLKEVSHFAFETMKIKRVEAQVHTSNKGSQRTLEKAGFLQEGLLRRRFERGSKHDDCYMYSLLSPAHE
ncbi:GNAT family N-acetyltransferase [Gorillibacterium sp. CAU 1737]|uniref:GNAT family N-acetyltransferase n=1 Tax=Gorillibacterium sp. CAU 1737 TaxID=3140362 RepID=UPI0032601952